MTGLFGDIDIDEIPEDPFFVAQGTYLANLTKAGKKKNKAGEGAFATQFKIDDPQAGSYDGKTLGTWQDLFEGRSAEDLTEQEEQSLSYFRQFLVQLGIPANEHKGWDGDCDHLLGMPYVVTVTESADKNDPQKKYSNIQSVRQYQGG